ncbi:MAG: FeoB small GTPase domain-containing protein [bacterium]
MKILLMGNPNVGKSVVFSRLTGIKVISSNYPGTTVEYTKGSMKYLDKRVDVIDVPGTYSLNPSCEAERVALKLVPEGDLIINVIDATNLERNLYLTFELIERQKPMVVVLNMWDDAQHRGIIIDVEQLEAFLRVPVIPIVAITGEGISDLVSRLPEAAAPKIHHHTKDEKWADIGALTQKVQRVTHHHHTLLQRFEDLSIHPFTGIIIALIVAWLTFWIVRFVGEGLINAAMDPLFSGFLRPYLMKLSASLGSSGFLHEILIGKLIHGQIDFTQSFGLLTTGFYVPFVMVLPYVLSFYFMLGFLEDLGYLPRIAVLADNFMHKIGLHGYAIIPTILAFGCSVPGIMATRILEDRRAKFITATLLMVGIPCMSQTAVTIGLVGKFGDRYILLIFSVLFLIWVSLGLFLNRFLKGDTPEILLEIPHYHFPQITALLKKLWMRIKGFLLEAIPIVLLGVLFVNILFHFGIMNCIAKLSQPIITDIMGLPGEVSLPLIIGFLRKDVAVGMLAPLNLNIKQLVIACTILSIYFPCIATFTILLKEIGFKDTAKAAVLMILLAIVTGGLMNFLWIY